MVPDKFNMVDMGGIDLIYMQGQELEGIYDKLVESIALCRYQCLYNWFFDDVQIPPTYVSMVLEDDIVYINEGISVGSDDIFHIHSLETEPVINSLSVTENGTYEPPLGVDGYSPVEVDVQPTLETLSVSENGTYTAPTGVDGYSSVEVDVQPTLQTLSVTENGDYNPPQGVDGFSSVSVSIPASTTLLANWDFTQSLVDSVKGLEVTLTNATRDSSGIHLTAQNSYALLPAYIYGGYRTFEFEVGDCQAVLSGNHLRFFSYGDDAGLIFRNSSGGYWCFYGSTWANNSGITDINYFKNSKVKIEIGDLKWKIYKDDVLVFTSNVAMAESAVRYKLGQSLNSFFPCVIKNLKIY